MLRLQHNRALSRSDLKKEIEWGLGLELRSECGSLSTFLGDKTATLKWVFMGFKVVYYMFKHLPNSKNENHC